MSDTSFDIFLDHCVDEYYEDSEEEFVDDDDWKIDKLIEDQIRSEDWYHE